MTSNNSKLSVRVQEDIRERLITFQAEHQIKSLSGAIGVILSKYFETSSSVPSEVETAEDRPPVEQASDALMSRGIALSTTQETLVTNIILKRIENLETRLFAEEQQRKELEIKLAVMEAELGKYRQTAQTARSQSEQRTEASTKGNKALYEEAENESNNGVSPSKTKPKTQSKGSKKLPQPKAQPKAPPEAKSEAPPEAKSEAPPEAAPPEAPPEQPLDSVETAPTPETANQVEKDSDVPVTPEAQKLETEESSSSDPLPEIMGTREISELLNWHRDKLEARKKRGNLPIEEGGYVIDCIGKEGRKLIWTVKRLK